VSQERPGRTGAFSDLLADRYRVERELGAGGMATVYLAEDLKHHRKVAIKVLHPELAAVLGSERFLKEIELTANLQHPHILPLFDSGVADGLLYYVMPHVDGETLRARLTRETQLAMPDAVRITSEVADALDYAHKQGVIHRDIKPENILLRDGHALLADFGIALAVREAGGNRLTQSGLSLGTPQYMSPEQATGHRQVDARTDVYSLAAVFYETVAGEPPVSGATAQAMIAKLLTERPAALSVLRDTVPASVSAAVTKALSKTPADRFSSAGEFVGAIQAGFAATETGAARPRRVRAILAVAGVAAVLVAAAVATMFAVRRRGPTFAAGDRIQLTTTGDVIAPAISGDGKQLAYFTKRCESRGCSYSVVIQDVGRSAKHVLLDNVETDGILEWSPDRRSLLVRNATLDGVAGTYLIPTLGGAPRLISSLFNSLAVDFYSEGDSLLLGSGFHADSLFWIRIASLDGVVHDSIRVLGTAGGIADAVAVPNTPWIVASTIRFTPREIRWAIVDRRGRVIDRAAPSLCHCGVLAASNEAIWLVSSASPLLLIRVPLDPKTGRLGTHLDTIRVSAGERIRSITADGTGLVESAGTTEYSVWALDLADALTGRFADSNRVARASMPIVVQTSPDGGRLLFDRTFPLPSGGTEHRVTVTPFRGGAETAVNTLGKIAADWWIDSVTLALSAVTEKGQRLVLHDARTGVEREETYIPDSLPYGVDHIPGGWAWLPRSGAEVVTRVAGQTRKYAKPAAAGALIGIMLDPHGHRVALVTTASTVDSLGVFVLSLDSGVVTQWEAFRATDVDLQWGDDGSLMADVSSEGTLTLYRLSSPGRMAKIGAIPRDVEASSVDRRARHIAVKTSDFHGDAWLLRVVRR
jgi:tRNA A-37 threonylcarbamoyl transferase component Bud32